MTLTVFELTDVLSAIGVRLGALAVELFIRLWGLGYVALGG